MKMGRTRVWNCKRTAKFLFVAIIATLVTVTVVEIGRQDVEYSDNEVQSLAGSATAEGYFGKFSYEKAGHGKWRQLTKEQIGNLSRLGRILYLDEERPQLDPNPKTYLILEWKFGHTIWDRHIKRFSNQTHDPFEFCHVRNCNLTYSESDLSNADLVILHMHRSKSSADLPPTKGRNPRQIWAFDTDESPHHTFGGNGGVKVNLSDYNGHFNWSMTYRMDSDIPIPYGRTVLRPSDHKFNVYSWMLTKRHDVLVAVMGSNCGGTNHRWQYIRELQRHIKVDVYGRCGPLKCSGHFRRDCPDIGKYMFYLSFENSNCDEYLTEKLWWNAYHKNAIPIVMGATKTSYAQLAPPGSYVDVEDFAAPRDLADYVRYLANTPAEMARYFEWKSRFAVLNEHGYFGSASYRYCRVCEALNYNERKPKVFKHLEKYLSVAGSCHPAWDAR